MALSSAPSVKSGNAVESISPEKMLSVEFKWIIPNFMFKYNTMGRFAYIRSNNFSAVGDERVQWRLQLWPKGDVNAHHSGYMSLYLYLVSADRFRMLVKYELALLNQKGENVYPTTPVFANILLQRKHGYSNFIRMTDLQELDETHRLLANVPESEDGSLIVLCKLQYEMDTTAELCSSTQLRSYSPADSSLSDQLSQLLVQGFLSDITIMVGDVRDKNQLELKFTEFKAHRSLLAARSPVFAAMFRYSSEEQDGSPAKKNPKRLVVVNTDPLAFKAMLHFIYTDKFPDPADIPLVARLLALADRYIIDLLKFKCEEFLAERLTIDNCSELERLADQRSATVLHNTAVRFMKQHASELLSKPGWIMAQRSVLAQPMVVDDIGRLLSPESSSPDSDEPNSTLFETFASSGSDGSLRIKTPEKEKEKPVNSAKKKLAERTNIRMLSTSKDEDVGVKPKKVPQPSRKTKERVDVDVDAEEDYLQATPGSIRPTISRQSLRPRTKKIRYS